MAGLVPAIRVCKCRQDVDARDKRGHDAEWGGYAISVSRAA